MCPPIPTKSTGLYKRAITITVRILLFVKLIVGSSASEKEPTQVGDYILTPDICLERKSISDLIQSLNSGRLYNQAQAMTRHYARPMLLIEFDKDKPFDLQDRYYLSTDSSSEQLVTKLQVLTLHFPQLRLVWSPSPQATAALFDELKQGQPQPNPGTAMAVGLDESPSDLVFNPGPQAFLQNLPGVTSKNLHPLLRNCTSIDKLRRMSVEELTTILENAVQAESLYKAFHNRLERSEDDGGMRRPMRPGAAKGISRKRFHER